ncbi:rho guanine nucleotide exchange factor 26 [Caerostris extrusa]|uniref:Rho guanine nucleotide exchange factor 26 n=1 Tax=Caerostris extrusa TaxID=172846 RepID=A0AAV4QVZ4_CAEEX|nr:rho guanine nucleotide exchange factor 26 [Caerostris extrusa]
MKSYLTEADNTADTSHPTPSTSRQPFKILQNLQQYHSHLMSKMASSAALRTVSKHAATSIKKQDAVLSSKTETSNTAANSVGSLTSSPKWSHIKNKFENGPVVDKNKLIRTTSLNSEENDDSRVQPSASKSLNSLVPEVKLSVGKNGIADKKRDTEISLNCENRATATKLKGSDDKSKSSSPKSSTSNIPRSNSPKNSLSNLSANVSSLHSALDSKRNTQVNKSSCGPNRKADNKPKQTTTQSSVRQSEPTKNSLLSEKDRILLNNVSNINKTCRVSTSTSKQSSSSDASDMNSASENVEKSKI